MGGLPETPGSPHLYPQALQLKLYQAFIFSIPILFSIILFLLFYLFYLKRRATSNLSSSSPHPPILPRISTHATPFLPFPCQLNLKVELKDKLPIVLFDEELRTRDSQCCVCLGEFEIKEELLQVPSCKHVFHVDCIHHWLHSNSTCPLCRCSVVPVTMPRIPHQSRRSSDQQPPPPQQTLPPQVQESSSSSGPSGLVDCNLTESVVVHIPEERNSP